MLNKIMLIGNVGADPDVKEFEDGNQVVTVSLATSESWKDKETGEKKEKTEWHRVVFWRGLAEVVSQYVKKGDKIYIEGSNKTRSWETEAGEKRYTTEIEAKEMKMLGGRAQEVEPTTETPYVPNPSEGEEDLPF